MTNYKDSEGFSRAQSKSEPKGKLTHISDVKFKDRNNFVCPECGHDVYAKCVGTGTYKHKPHFSHRGYAPKHCIGVTEQTYKRKYEKNQSNTNSMMFTPYVEPPKKTFKQRFHDISEDVKNSVGEYYHANIIDIGDDVAAKEFATLLRDAANLLDPIVEPEPVKQVVISKSTDTKRKIKNYTVLVLKLENGKYWIDYALEGSEVNVLKHLLNNPEHPFLISNSILDTASEFKITCTHDELKKFMAIVECGVIKQHGIGSVEQKYNRTSRPTIPSNLNIFESVDDVFREMVRIGMNYNLITSDNPTLTIVSNTTGLKFVANRKSLNLV